MCKTLMFVPPLYFYVKMTIKFSASFLIKIFSQMSIEVDPYDLKNAHCIGNTLSNIHQSVFIYSVSL